MTETLREKVVEILDDTFRHTLEIRPDEDIPSAADDIVKVVTEARDLASALRAEFEPADLRKMASDIGNFGDGADSERWHRLEEVLRQAGREGVTP